MQETPNHALVPSPRLIATPIARLFKKTVEGRTLIAKRTRLQTQQDERFCLNEAHKLKLCRHPCVVRHIRSHVEEGGVFNLEMEWLSGGSLSGVVPGPGNTLWRWLTQVTSALGHLHGLGVLHRDIKPDNIALDAHGNAKLIDFGSAAFKSDLPLQGFPAAGSPAYTAPEILRGEGYDEKVDVWALGVTTFELVYGRKPFLGHTRQEYWRNTLLSEVAYDDCPAELVELMRKMLAKDPAKRISIRKLLKEKAFRGRLPRCLA